MKIEIRHQISDTYEEIYGFEIGTTYIKYNTVWISRRNSVNDVWGYDWSKYYKSQERFEIEKLREKEKLDKYDADDMLYETDSRNEFEKICKKYNPIMNKTDSEEPLLGGCYSNSLMKNHPPKIEPQQLKELIKKKVLSIIEKSEIK
jgi:hypothetical protein